MQDVFHTYLKFRHSQDFKRMSHSSIAIQSDVEKFHPAISTTLCAYIEQLIKFRKRNSTTIWDTSVKSFSSCIHFEVKIFETFLPAVFLWYCFLLILILSIRLNTASVRDSKSICCLYVTFRLTCFRLVFVYLIVLADCRVKKITEKF